MPTIPDKERFTRALIDYFDDDSQPGYSPTAAIDGNARISAHFPEHAVELRGQIDQMFESAFNLPDLPSLALDDAMAAIRRFMASEYPFLPSVLQEKVVNCCGYSLWK